MTNKKNHHLDEDGIIRAIIDQSDLSDSRRTHLSRCTRCQSEKERLEQDLARLGGIAERFSPIPDKELALTEKSVQHATQWLWRWQIALGVAMVAALMIIFIWSSAPEKRNIEHFFVMEMMIPETGGVDPFMIETSGLSENVLPQVYLDISGEIEPEFYEEFIEFVSPLIDNNSLTLYIDRKGVVKPC